MQTIGIILDAAEKLKESGLKSEINIGSFNLSVKNYKKRERDFIVSFILEIKPSHIQTLLDMGLSISFESAKMAGLSENSLRFKHGREAIKQGDFAPYFYKGDPKNEQTGVIDNWLNFEAKCTTDVLAKLDKYCRDNHLAYISITNNSNLKQIGWPFKNKYASTITIESQYKNITAIRRTTIGKKSNRLLPIQKRVLGLK